MTTEARRFSQLTAAGHDLYNKEVGARHVWLYQMMSEEQRRRERWSPSADMTPYVQYIRRIQDEYERMLNQVADQLLNPGYDPYNHVNGARVVFRLSAPSHATTRKS